MTKNGHAKREPAQPSASGPWLSAAGQRLAQSGQWCVVLLGLPRFGGQLGEESGQQLWLEPFADNAMDFPEIPCWFWLVLLRTNCHTLCESSTTVKIKIFTVRVGSVTVVLCSGWSGLPGPAAVFTCGTFGPRAAARSLGLAGPAAPHTV